MSVSMASGISAVACMLLYATDLNKPPIGDMKMRWPGREPYQWHFS